METLKIFVPATIGNVGPGFDVLGLAVEGLGDTFTITKSDETKISLVRGVDAKEIPTDPEKNTVTIAANALFKDKKQQMNVDIKIERQLPMSGGLGSSAAASVAGALAAATLLGCSEDHEAIIHAALCGEAKVSGWHLDNIAPCYYGGLTIVQNTSPPNIVQVAIKAKWWIVLFMMDIRLDTKEARKVLPNTVAQELFVKQMANTASIVAAFSQDDSDLLQASMGDYYAQPHRARFIRQFSELKNLALESGALACGISGAGPTLFAIAKDQNKAELVAKGMLKVFHGQATYHIGQIAERGARML